VRGRCYVEIPDHVHAHPQSRDVHRNDPITGNSAPVQSVEHHEYGHKNTALIALILASVAVGAILVSAILMPYVIALSVDKGNAEVRASVQQQIAEATAVANTGRTNSRVALDKIEDMRVKLAEKGIKVPPLDGH
jgi:hypothetical protein